MTQVPRKLFQVITQAMCTAISQVVSRIMSRLMSRALCQTVTRVISQLMSQAMCCTMSRTDSRLMCQSMSKALLQRFITPRLRARHAISKFNMSQRHQHELLYHVCRHLKGAALISKFYGQNLRSLAYLEHSLLRDLLCGPPRVEMASF